MSEQTITKLPVFSIAADGTVRVQSENTDESTRAFDNNNALHDSDTANRRRGDALGMSTLLSAELRFRHSGQDSEVSGDLLRVTSEALAWLLEAELLLQRTNGEQVRATEADAVG